MIRIGYLSFQNPYTDRGAWSGTSYKIRESVEAAGYEVKWIPIRQNKWIDYPYRAFLKFLFGRKCTTSRTVFHCRLCAKGIDTHAIDDCDYLFCPEHNGYYASFLKHHPKIISYNDHTFEQMNDYYWFNQSEWMKRQGNRCERNCIEKSFLTIKSSHWAADSVLQYYHGDINNTEVLLFGANIDDSDIKPCVKYCGGTLNVIFSGVDWERKGGAVAIEAVAEMRNKGVDAKLFIMGIRNLDVSISSLPYVDNVGFLSKNDREQYGRYVGTWSKGHIFLLPTKAECAGTVFCEASAYGLPIFTYDTGGTGDYVRNGINGYRLGLESTGREFAEKILNSMETDELTSLSEGGRQLYRDELCWQAWSRKFRQLIEHDLQNK